MVRYLMNFMTHRSLDNVIFSNFRNETLFSIEFMSGETYKTLQMCEDNFQRDSQGTGSGPKVLFFFVSKWSFFFKNLSKVHLTQKEIDGLEKMRSLLFHHSWKNEAASLASHIKLDKNIIYAIKSTEELGSTRTSSTSDHVRRALINLDPN